GQGPAWLREGPFGWRWLAPDAALGLEGWSRLARALVLSLGLGFGLTAWLALRSGARPSGQGGALERERLRALAGRFVAPERLQHLLGPAREPAAVDAASEVAVERELSAVLGAASTRLLLDAARRDTGSDLDTVAELVDEAAQALR